MQGTISFKTNDAIMLLVLLVGIGMVGWGFGLIGDRSNRGKVDSIVREMTYQKTYALGGLGIQERKNKYVDRCIQIWHVYGFAYHKPSKKYPVPQAMSKEERVLVWDENFRLAELLGFANLKTGTGYYDVICKGVLENALDPNNPGANGEEGWLQEKHIAIMEAASIHRYIMPDRLREAIYFSWDGTAEAAKDPVFALRVAYILMWYYRREYKGIETWYISLYHWGSGFLGKHFNNGTGRFPTKFTISGIDYNPILYYISYRMLKEAFDDGDLEAGKPVVEKWNRYKRKMVKEESQLLRTHKTIKDLRRQMTKLERTVQDKEDLEAESQVLVDKLRVSLDDSERKFKEIYAQIGKWKKGNLRVYMKSKGIEIVKEFLEQITDHTSDNIATIAILAAILLLGIGGGVMAVIGVRSLIRKRDHEQEGGKG